MQEMSVMGNKEVREIEVVLEALQQLQYTFGDQLVEREQLATVATCISRFDSVEQRASTAVTTSDVRMIQLREDRKILSVPCQRLEAVWHGVLVTGLLRKKTFWI